MSSSTTTARSVNVRGDHLTTHVFAYSTRDGLTTDLDRLQVSRATHTTTSLHAYADVRFRDIKVIDGSIVLSLTIVDADVNLYVDDTYTAIDALSAALIEAGVALSDLIAEPVADLDIEGVAV